MLFSKASIFTAATTLAGLVSAQSKTVHVVKVGPRLTFQPEEVNAELGDKVQFQFQGGLHSVARSDFANPCVPLDPATANGTVGFFSGDMNVKESDQYMPTFTILVNETTPIWYYCAVVGHCEGGMVGVINPPRGGDKTLDNYKKASKEAKTVPPDSESGGEIDPDGEGPKPPVTPGNTGNTSTPSDSPTGRPTGTGSPTGSPTDTPTGSPTGSSGNTTTTGTGTGTGTGAPTSTPTNMASSLFASAASVILGAMAVAAFLI